MIIITFLYLCIISGFCQELSEIKHPSDVNDSDHDVGIVGGYNALIENHPYQVAIFLNNHFICGGFIITKNYILTAAHCIQTVRDPRTLFVRAGSTFKSYGGELITISKVRIHPLYGLFSPTDHDVGVMKTVFPIKFNNVIQPIGLPNMRRPMQKGTYITVSGWGNITHNSSSDHLMAVQAPVVDLALCGIHRGPARSMFCAGSDFKGAKGTCPGDSGGAATQDGLAVGVVSFGPQPCMAPHPGGFADLATPSVRDFITQVTGL